MTETITRRQVRHPKDFGDRELFKRTFTHWMPSEKVDTLYSELQGDFKKVCELSIEELKHYGLTQRDAIAFLSKANLCHWDSIFCSKYPKSLWTEEARASCSVVLGCAL